MKNLILLIALCFFALKEVNAENRCAFKAFQEKNFCVIAGGTADTNKTVNQAHARSLALKTARFLAYEKLAERIKGVMLSSRHEFGQELLGDAQLQTLVEAQLKNVSFEEERLSFLADGSPWAEVTVSAPKMALAGESQEALKYQNGQRQEASAPTNFVIDARDVGSLPLFFEVVGNGKTLASYNPISSKIKFLSGSEEMNELESAKIISAKGLVDGKLELDGPQAKALQRHLIDYELSADAPIYILK